MPNMYRITSIRASTEYVKYLNKGGISTWRSSILKKAQ